MKALLLILLAAPAGAQGRGVRVIAPVARAVGLSGVAQSLELGHFEAQWSDPATRLDALDFAAQAPDLTPEALRAVARAGRDEPEWVDENMEPLAEKWKTLQRKRAGAYWGDPREDQKLRREAERAERAGDFVGAAWEPTEDQKGPTCVLCALDNAVRAGPGWADGGSPHRVGELVALARRKIPRKVGMWSGVDVGQVAPFLEGELGVPMERIRLAEMPEAAEDLVARIEDGQQLMAFMRYREADGTDTQHEVFLRSAFYSRKRKTWVFGVQDSAKGEIDYFTWRRLSAVLEEVHALRFDGPVAAPPSLFP